MNDRTIVLETDLTYIFPEIVVRDIRTGYEGYVVQADKLLELATALRDDLGYDYLSSITGVDYLPDGKMEVVYHIRKSTGGAPLVIKTQVQRENPVIASLISVYPGADFQEREAWDLLGIRFDGHPDLRRILMWEGFEGHPLRKDWREGYFEDENKPFKIRWPEGHIVRAEVKNPFGRNVDYPAGFNPEIWIPESETSLYAGLERRERKDDNTGGKT